MIALDPAEVMAAHGDLHSCTADGWGVYWNMRVSGEKCEPYRLAEALATEPDRTRAAVVKALRASYFKPHAWAIAQANAIEKGADW